MRILKTNGFTKFAKKERITDRMLRDTVKEIANGLKGSPQGSSVYKQRVARPGKGKSGGFRTMIVFRKEDRVIFIEGYAKNEQSTLSPVELKVVRKFATELLKWTDRELDALVKQGVLQEITDG